MEIGRKMNKSRSIRGNTSSGSIWKTPLATELPDANEHEKAHTSTINIQALQSISKIVQAIKKRIDAGETNSREDDTQACLAGDPRSTIPTCANRGEHNNRENEEGQ